MVGWKTPSNEARRDIQDAAHITTEHGGNKVEPAGNTFTYAAVVNQFFAWTGLGLAAAHAASPEPARGFQLSFAPYAKLSARRVETMKLTREGRFDEVEAIVVPVQTAYEQGEVNEFMAYVKKELARGLDDWEQRLSTAMVKSSPTDLVRATPPAANDKS